MKKRLTSLLLVFSILLSLLPVSVFATREDREMTSTQTPSVQHENPFTDVKESDWFYDAV